MARAAGALPAPHPRILPRGGGLCDREAEVFSFLSQGSRLPNTSPVVRVAQNRLQAEGEFRTLFPALEALPALGYFTVAVRDQANQPARQAKLAVSFGTFDLTVPVSERGSSPADSLRVNVVRACEVDGPLECQFNPHPPDSLAWVAWVAWIIARLGGWTSGNPKRPPGVMTFY